METEEYLWFSDSHVALECVFKPLVACVLRVIYKP